MRHTHVMHAPSAVTNAGEQAAGCVHVIWAAAPLACEHIFLVSSASARRRRRRTLGAHRHEHGRLGHIVRQRHPRRPGPAALRQDLELESWGGA